MGLQTLATQQKATAVKSSLFDVNSCALRNYVMDVKLKSFFTIRLTERRNISTSRAICFSSTVCLWQIFLAISTSSILSAVRAMRGWPLLGSRFEVPVRPVLRIILSNPLRDQLL